MAPGVPCRPDTAAHADIFVARRVADWLSLGGAPTFAGMAALTAVSGGGAHDLLCAAAPHASALHGMAPMYGLMSVFHVVPWLKRLAPR